MPQNLLGVVELGLIIVVNTCKFVDIKVPLDGVVITIQLTNYFWTPKSMKHAGFKVF